MSTTKTLSKSELAKILQVSSTYVHRCLNVEYIIELTAIGYNKKCIYLRGKVLERVKELFCITDEDIIDIKKIKK